jgi:catechol 2,3-dioxygenase-like lactoylglutathione lyase family enzyme
VDDRATLLGIEIVVSDLDRAVAFFADVLGMEVLQRGPSALVEGETALVDAGAVAITLLAPKDHGPGRVLPNREPRVSQLVLGAGSPAALAGLRDHVVEAGLAVVPVDDASFYVTPEAVTGALGIATAIVAVPAPEDGA